MTNELAISLALLGVLFFWALANWHAGLLLCLATAIMQDPLRKLTPDQPIVFVGFVVAVFGAACLGALVRGVSLYPNHIFRQHRWLATPFLFLFLLIIAQAMNSYLRFDNLMLTALGVLTYVMPLFSTMFAYQLACRQGELRIRQFMKWYVILIGLALTTVYLEFSGYHWSVFGQVGTGLVIYDRATGSILPSFSGLFRASEIAAWHAMTAACVVVLLIFWRKASLPRLLIALGFAAVLIGIGILTGRRKVVIEFVVFLSTLSMLWVIFGGHLGRVGTIGSVAGAAVTYAFYALFAAGLQEGVSAVHDKPETSIYAHYVQHSEKAFGQVPARFVELGIAPVMWAYDSYGLAGAGLGAGTQGAQYFGSGGATGGAAEGGLGKITLELGIPGLFVMAWITISICRYLWGVMRFASQYSPSLARLSFGLCSLLAANIAGFSVATQLYGDLFVLLTLSWTLGFLLAVPVMVERQVRARQQLATVQRGPAIFQPRTV